MLSLNIPLYRLWLLLISGSLLAGNIVTDNTFGPRNQLNGAGGYKIPDTLGSRRGGNLFYSFENFQLDTGETATFWKSQSGTIESIFARVTGPNVSKINGTIESTIPGASLYFLNPNGVEFGRDAKVIVDGSFAVSTAQKLTFADGADFSAVQPESGDSLTSASLSSFGFLGSKQPGKISFCDSVITMVEGRSFSVIGGELSFESPTSSGKITVPSGQVILTSVASSGDVGLDGTVTGVGVLRFDHQGIAMESFVIDTTGPTGGGVDMRAPHLKLNVSRIFSGTTGEGSGLPIRLNIDGHLDMERSSIGTSTTFNGTAGAVSVNARTARIAASPLGSIAEVNATSAASAGAVHIRGGKIQITNGGQISSSSEGNGQAGDVTVTARRNLLLDQKGSTSPTGIFANTFGGRGGDISVRAGSLTMTNRGSITSNTSGPGNAGDVRIHAGTVSISNFGRITSNTRAGGNSGRVNVSASNLLVTSGAQIAADTAGNGRGGNVTVSAETLQATYGGRISANTTNKGAGGNVSIRATQLQVSGNGRISTNTNNHGNGGVTTVSADSIRIGSGGSIEANAGELRADEPFGGRGHGGNISVTAGTLSIVGDENSMGTGVFAGNDSPDRRAHGGSISVNADQLSISDGGLITTRTAGPGFSGDIKIKAGDIHTRRGDSKFFTGIAADSAVGNSGSGGDVRIEAQTIMVSDGAQITSNTAGNGDGGEVAIKTAQLTVIDAIVGTESTTPGHDGVGGDVDIEAGTLTVLQGGRISATTFNNGAAGDVRVRAGDVSLGRGFSLTTGIFSGSESETERGEGGSVWLSARRISLQAGARISATTRGPGNGGSVFVDAASVALEGISRIESASIGEGSAGSVSIISRSSIALRGGSSITVKAAKSDAGSIRLIAPDYITLQNSKILAEAGLNGGDVFIDPQFVILDHSSISANAKLGAGGNITVISDTFLPSESGVTASSEKNVQGTVDIQSPDAQLANALTALPGGLLGIEIRLSDRCPMRLSSELSSFLVIGRGGLPPAPEDLR